MQKVVVSSMDDAIEEVGSEKGIDPATIRKAIEDAVAEAYRAQVKTDLHVRTTMKGPGRFHIEAEKIVVETVNDSLTEIAQSDPRAKGYGLGDSIFVEVSEVSVTGKHRANDDFGRVAALQAKAVIKQKLKEAERLKLYQDYKGREGELVHGKVQCIRNGNIIVELGRVEAILPRRDIIPRERFKEQDRIKAVIREVRLDQKGCQIVLSRTHPWFVQRLFEMEVTEVYDKTVEIRAIAREAGFRTKIAVFSKDSAVDPVGACVGQKGIRVQTVVKELGGEKIDIAYWDSEPHTFIREALKPATVDRILLDGEHRSADVIVPDDQLSLAIGKDGQNARLAARLTEWNVNIRSAAEISRAQARELLQVTFGSTPEQVCALVGVGPETAPALVAAGLAELEKLATAATADLAAVLGESGAITVSDKARVQWAEWQAKAQKLIEEAAGGEAKAATGRVAKEIQPFVLSSGKSATNVEELTAVLDEMPGDELEKVLQSDALKNWLQDLGLEPTRIADLMARYR